MAEGLEGTCGDGEWVGWDAAVTWGRDNLKLSSCEVGKYFLNFAYGMLPLSQAYLAWMACAPLAQECPSAMCFLDLGLVHLYIL